MNNFFDTEELTTQDLFDTAPVSKTDDVLFSQFAAVETARTEDDNKSPLEFYYNYKKIASDSGTQEAINYASRNWKQYQYSLYKDIIEDVTLNGTPEDAVSTVDVIRDMVLSEDTSPWKGETIISEASGGTEDEAIRMWLERKIAERVVDQGFFAKAGNFLGSLLPDSIADASSLTGADYWEAGQAFKDIIFSFNALSPVEKMKAWPALLDKIQNATEDFGIQNQTKFIEMAREFLDPANVDNSVAKKALEDMIDVTIVSDGPALVSGLIKSAKNYNAVRALRMAGDEQSSAAVNVAALMDESGEVAQAAGVDAVTAAANASPVNWGRVIEGATDNISPRQQRMMEEVATARENFRASIEETITGANRLDENILNAAEKHAAIEKGKSSLNDLIPADLKEEGYEITNVSVINEDGRGFNLSFDFVDPQGKRVWGGKDRRINYGINDAGKFTHEVELGPITSKIYSPEMWLENILPGAISQATRAEFTRAKVWNEFNQAVKVAQKGLNRQGRINVDNLLMKGSKEEREFTMDDFFHGIDFGDGQIHQFSQREIESYYQFRDMFKGLHYMKNKQVRDSLVFQGFKEVKLGAELEQGNLKSVIAHPYSSAGSIPQELRTNTQFLVFDTRGRGATKKAVDVDFTEAYHNGYSVVKLREAEKVGDDLLQYAIVRNGAVKELRDNVLHQIPGYVPRIYENGYYFVKKVQASKINGISEDKVTTMRVFSSKREADEWAQGVQNSVDGAGEEAKIVVLHDRENPFDVEAGYMLDSGGLFTSPRGEAALKFGRKGEEAHLKSAFESLQRNLQNVANNVPMNEFRMGVVQRWIAQAKAMDAFVDPRNPSLTAELRSTMPIRKLNALEESRKWIYDQLRIPTESERKYSDMMWKMAERMEYWYTPDKARRFVADMASKDPFSALRGAAFHAHLGWFNPAQLFVQAQGFSIAFGLDPKNFMRDWRRYSALRSIYDVTKADGAVKIAAKAAGVDAAELKLMRDAAKRVGILDAVSKSSADYAAAAQGWGGNGFAALAAQKVRKVSEYGLIPFNEGERFTRGYAFVQAFAEWRAKHPTGDLTDDALKVVMEQTIHKMLNLTRANRAHWQKGALSIPTQFMQYTAKFMEGLGPEFLPFSGKFGKLAEGGKKFTPEQRARIILGQTLLYGSAGVPLATMVMEYAQEMADLEPNFDNSAAVTAVTQGLTGLMARGLADGVELDTAKRFAGASGVEDILEVAYTLITNPSAVEADMLGAFGGMAGRAWEGMKWMAPIVANPVDYEFNLDEFVQGVDFFTDIIGTFNNATKAYVWYNSKNIKSKNGALLMEIDDDDLVGTVMAKAFGFSPKELTDIYSLKQFNTALVDRKKAFSTGYLKAFDNYVLSERPTEASMHNMRVRLATLANILDLREHEVDELIASANERIINAESEKDKQRKKALDTFFYEDRSVIGGKGINFNSVISE